MMNRKGFIYITDLILVPLFILSLYTGIELHIAGHGDNHEIWHNWAAFHTIISLLFTTFTITHIKSHWGWYKGLRVKNNKKDVTRKRKIVLLLSVIFISVAITGISLLLCIDEAGTPTGLAHYKAGIIMGILGALHILKRIHFLLKKTESLFRSNRDSVSSK